jgi:hypothetical protein
MNEIELFCFYQLTHELEEFDGRAPSPSDIQVVTANILLFCKPIEHRSFATNQKWITTEIMKGCDVSENTVTVRSMAHVHANKQHVEVREAEFFAHATPL